MVRKTLFFTLPLLALAACGSKDDPNADPNMGPEGASAGNVAVASLLSADDKPMGEVLIANGTGGLQLNLSVNGMSAGEHGVHIHEAGDCSGDGFKSAGGHWNPEGHKHGLEAADGAHRGDMPNLSVAEDGTGSLEFMIGGATVNGIDSPLLDADGAAFIVHAGPDDQKTDPSGNSGDRIACGVFKVRPSVMDSSAAQPPADQ